MTDETPPHDQQLARAIANTVWPYLRARDEHGDDTGWGTYRETRALSPTGNPKSYTYSGAGHIAGPEPTVELISITHLIVTYLWREDWPGDAAYRIVLERDATRRRISMLNANTIADYEAALEHATCRKPFTVATDEHGERYLTRNRNDGTITHLVAAALEAIARTAELRRIPPEVEAALLGDSDISLNAINAALQRAGEPSP